MLQISNDRMTVKALAEVPALLDLPALPSGSTQSSSFTLDDECMVTKKNQLHT